MGWFLFDVYKLFLIFAVFFTFLKLFNKNIFTFLRFKSLSSMYALAAHSGTKKESSN